MPIIFLTGHGRLSMGVEAMKKGAIDFLTKPCDDEQLLGAVHSAIEKDKQARGSYKEKQEMRGRIELLTPREHEILRYVISGMLNKQIALKLGVAEWVKRIRSKAAVLIAERIDRNLCASNWKSGCVSRGCWPGYG